MARHGWLRCARRAQDRRQARKNYLLTAKGRLLLDEVKNQLRELSKEVLD
jgi:DNA-binding PadR family transcriptional regulator